MSDERPSRPGPTERIGRYAVEEVVGTGAFATVYRARDERLEGHVALKVLAENHAFDPDLRERFILEGRLLRRVSSPNVITVHDLGETDRAQPFLVLDLATGGDLRRRSGEARAAGWLPTRDDVIAVASSVAEAMATLHAASVVHRDLAPGNLLIVGSAPAGAPTSPAGDDGRAVGAPLLAEGERLVVADLGLSKDLAAASGLTVGTGTTGFTPPEQRTAGSWVDTRADIWSASALLLWLLTGDGPDDASWPTEVAAAGWPRSFVAALRRGLDPDPDRRPTDAAAWRNDIDAALGGPPGATPVDGGPAPAVGPATSARRRNDRVERVDRPGGGGPARWRIVAAAAVAALLVALAGVAVGRGLQDEPAPDRLSERTELDDGQVRFSSDAGPSTLEVTGPGGASVGQTVELVAGGDGIETSTWVVPDGNLIEGEERITLTPSSEGTATVVVVGRDADGRQLVVEYRLQVRG